MLCHWSGDAFLVSVWPPGPICYGFYVDCGAGPTIVVFCLMRSDFEAFNFSMSTLAALSRLLIASVCSQRCDVSVLNDSSCYSGTPNEVAFQSSLVHWDIVKGAPSVMLRHVAPYARLWFCCLCLAAWAHLVWFLSCLWCWPLNLPLCSV